MRSRRGVLMAGLALAAMPLVLAACGAGARAWDEAVLATFRPDVADPLPCSGTRTSERPPVTSAGGQP